MNVATTRDGRRARASRRRSTRCCRSTPVDGAPACGCRTPTAGACSTSTAATRSRRSGYGHPRLADSARASRRATLLFQSNAVPLDVRDARPTRLAAFAAARARPRLLRQQRRRGERERAASSPSRSRGRTQVVAVEGRLPRPHGGGGAVTWGAERSGTASRARRSTSPFVPRERHRGARARRVDSTTPRPSSSSRCRASPARSTSAREFLRACARAVRRRGALLIFDEVQCGMGRTGQPFAAQLLRRHARHAHDRQGARRRLPVRRRC